MELDNPAGVTARGVMVLFRDSRGKYLYCKGD